MKKENLDKMVETHCCCCGCRMIIRLDEAYSAYDPICKDCEEAVEEMKDYQWEKDFGLR